MKQRVLFVCTGNSARSQMAEALLRLMAADRFDAFSAGTHPGGVHPSAVEAMRELGVDIGRQRSKSLAAVAGQSFDYVITVCDRAKENCPVFPGTAHVLHWSFEDPVAAGESERREVFRLVRDAIADAICRFLREETHLSVGTFDCYRCRRE